MINSNNNNDKNFVTSSEIPPPRNFSKNIDGAIHREFVYLHLLVQFTYCS